MIVLTIETDILLDRPVTCALCTCLLGSDPYAGCFVCISFHISLVNYLCEVLRLFFLWCSAWLPSAAGVI